MDITIRNESRDDFRIVEEVTREAFWNLFVPGCNEHYLAHIMRNHPDFIPDLDFVALDGNRIIGNIMYTRSHLIADSGSRLDTLTFGPVSVLPDYQRRGVGSALIRHSIQKATADNHTAIIIQGHPYNYCKHGFKSAKDFGMRDSDGKFPYSLLVLELRSGILGGHEWRYFPSAVYDVDITAAEEFDKEFAPKKKEYRYTQEEFSISCRAYL